VPVSWCRVGMRACVCVCVRVCVYACVYVWVSWSKVSVSAYVYVSVYV